jgi:hypothetical protein
MRFVGSLVKFADSSKRVVVPAGTDDFVSDSNGVGFAFNRVFKNVCRLVSFEAFLQRAASKRFFNDNHCAFH